MHPKAAGTVKRVTQMLFGENEEERGDTIALADWITWIGVIVQKEKTENLLKRWVAIQLQVGNKRGEDRYYEIT